MPYIIDGHNLIPKIPGLSLRAMDDEIALIERLQAFCRQTGKDVDVYFDNAPLGGMRVRNFGRVTAYFVRSGRTADDAIAARLQRLGRAARNWTVVSSDRQVQAAARGAQARVISSDEFALRLTGTSQTASESVKGEDVLLDEDEINEWLNLFSGKG
jgi:predicted RNA-binding protein with PIN domain